MRSKADFDWRHNLKYDIPAGIIVFLVALPLCLGIAQASGAPLFSGIIAGIVGGIVVGFFSGSQLGVSGPAAGLAAIVLSAINQLGTFETFLLAVAISGLLQLIFGLLQWGIISYYVPNSVIKGMLASIGLIIILKEIPYALGTNERPKVDWKFSSLMDNIGQFLGGIHYGVLIITSLSLGLLILWEQKFIKRFRFFKIIQGPLVVVLLGIILQFIFRDSHWALSSKALVALPVSEGFAGFFSQFTLPDFSQWNNPKVYTAALSIAAIGSIESLLCMEATDKMDPFKRVSPANKELTAQGMGNLISGLVGGIPVVQVIVRGTTNIQSGGRTKMSTIVHGVLLLICVLAIPHLLNYIPLASLAAILLMVGYKLTKPVIYTKIFREGWDNFIPFITTILITLITNDLLIGIGVGLAVAIFFVLYKNYQKPFSFERSKFKQDGIIRIELAEEVSFLNKANIQRALNLVPENSHVILDGSKCKSMDQDVIDIIEDFKIHCKYLHIRFDYIEPHLTKSDLPSPIEAFEHALDDLIHPNRKK